MTRLLDDAMSRGFETVRQLIAHEGFTVELGEAIRKSGGVDRAIGALNREFFPIVSIEASSPVSPPVPKRRRDMGDHIILPVVVDRVSTGEEWIARTDAKGNRTDDYGKNVLRSKKFQTTPIGTYEVAVLKASSFSSDPTTKQVRAWGKGKKFSDPNSDIACFIREQYSDDELKEMGLWWIVVMHEPIFSGDFSNLIGVVRGGDGRWLDACGAGSDGRWGRNGGFAFLVSQVSLST